MITKCDVCGRKTDYLYVWDVAPCSLGDVIERRLCFTCDYNMNETILRFFDIPDTNKILDTYMNRHDKENVT